MIAGDLPTVIGTGTFQNQGGTGPESLLTDGGIGFVQNNSITNYVTCGSDNGGGGAVSNIVFTLPASAGGYNITNIQVYGGWDDNGRDAQRYTISYSTVSAPATFVQLDDVYYQPAPPNNPSTPTVNHVTFVSATPGAPMATNVYAVEFDFTIPNEGGDWVGYSQIQVFGTPSAVTPGQTLVLSNMGISGGNLILNGSGGSPGASYTLLTTTNLALPLADWTTYSTGSFDGSGALSASIPVNPSVPSAFFLLQSP